MKKNAILLLVLLILPINIFAFGGGDGSSGSPYQIQNCTDLQNIKDDLDGYYVLTQNVDCSGFSNFTPIAISADFNGQLDGDGFTISDLTISTTTTVYLGIFATSDGEIKDLIIDNITVTSTQDTGRFGGLVAYNRGTITNIDISGSVGTGIQDSVGLLVGGNDSLGVITNATGTGTVSGNDYVGGLIGTNAGSVSNATFSGDVSAADDYLGGLVGENANGGSVTNSDSAGTVTGEGNYLGGLVGYNSGSISESFAAADVSSTDSYGLGGFVGGNEGDITSSYATGSVYMSYSAGSPYAAGGFVGSDYGTISECYATGDVTMEGDLVGPVGYAAGGFAGEAGGIIERSYATGNVVGFLAAGGFCGELYGEISNSYSRGNATGEGDVAGFCGYVDTGTTILKSYSTGLVTGDTGVSGFASVIGGTVSDSFWDIETSGQVSSDYGTGTTTLAMKLITTFTDLATEGLDEVWDFDTIWGINPDENDGYPFLRWQGFTHDPDGPDPAPEPVPEPQNNSNRSSGGGCSVKCKVNNLIKQGKNVQAQELMNKWPKLFPQNNVAVVNNTNTGATIFSRDLTIGFVGEDVRDLQKLLNKLGYIVSVSGPGSVGNETSMFGALTQAALIKYQKENGIVPAVGYFGPITRASLLGK